MVEPSKRNVRLAAQFLEIANRYTAEGWIEYLLWETLEGTRDRPFAFLELLPSEEMEVLQALRDEAKIWFFWQNAKWNHVPIAKWREHVATRTANDVLQELHGKRTG